MIVEVDGIMSRKELNGQLGIATAYDDAKGRLAVRLIFDRSIVSLKVDNERWAGVPMMITAGKGLSERTCTVEAALAEGEYVIQ